MNPDDKPADDNNNQVEEFNPQSLADSLLASSKGEEIKADEKPADENKGEEQAKPGAEAEKTAEEIAAAEKAEADKKAAEDGKPADDKPADPNAAKPADDKAESKSTEEDNKPLTREDVKAALREEQQAREAATNERQSFSGKVRSDLKEALKLDSSYTTVALDDGTPINSVEQLTQVINPATEEPYTREEAATLLLDARKIVDDNIAAYEKRVDELTDINVSFKEEADEVDRLYGDVLKAFPDVAKDLLEAYQKTFTVSADGQYVESVPVSPLAFYGPALRPFRNATDQVAQQQADAKAAEEKAAKEAAAKAEQEDRGDLSGTASPGQGKPNPLADALDKHLASLN